MVAIAILPACINGYQGNTYTSFIDPLTADNVVPLVEGEKPKLIFSENIEEDKEKYQSRGFVIIGLSEFENTSEVRFLKRKIDSHANRAIGHAMKVKATHILYLRKKISEYSETTVNDGKYETQFFN